MVEYGFEQRSFQTTNVRVFVICLVLIALAVWAIVLSPDHGGVYPALFHRTLRVDFINVGQGDSILIQTPRGKNFLVDGGVSVPLGQAKNQNREIIQHYLSQQGIRQLDGIVVTHYHNDHLGGIVPVLRQLGVKKIWDPGGEFNTETYKDYISLCEKKRIPRITVKTGDVLDWGKELSVTVLNPERVATSLEFSDINNTSVTLLVRFGKFSMLLAGDIEDPVQRELWKYGDDLNCSIIKVPHHGSDTSIYKPFIQKVEPDFGIIMVGRENPFGHPTKPMLSLYKQEEIQLYRTDHHGSIKLEITGKDEKEFSFRVDRNT